MNFSDVIVDSLKYPFSDVKKLLIMFLLLLGSIILIPVIVAYGYLLRIIEHTLQGSDELPDFGDWGDLLGDGIKFIAVGIVYGIPSFAIVLLIMTQSSGTLWGINSVLLLSLVSVLVGFLINIFLSIGLANMVYEKRFGAAFAFGRILELIKQIGWKRYLAFLVILTAITEVLSFIMGLITGLIQIGGVGIFIQLFVISAIFNCYLFIFTSRFRGLIYPNKLEVPEYLETQEDEI